MGSISWVQLSSENLMLVMEDIADLWSHQWIGGQGCCGMLDLSKDIKKCWDGEADLEQDKGLVRVKNI